MLAVGGRAGCGFRVSRGVESRDVVLGVVLGTQVDPCGVWSREWLFNLLKSRQAP